MSVSVQYEHPHIKLYTVHQPLYRFWFRALWTHLSSYSEYKPPVLPDRFQSGSPGPTCDWPAGRTGPSPPPTACSTSGSSSSAPLSGKPKCQQIQVINVCWMFMVHSDRARTGPRLGPGKKWFFFFNIKLDSLWTHLEATSLLHQKKRAKYFADTSHSEWFVGFLHKSLGPLPPVLQENNL